MARRGETESLASGSPVILYTQAGCAESGRVRAWLSARGTAFVEREVTDDSQAARDLAATGVFATPLVVVGDRTLLGFRPRKLAAVLPGEVEK